MPTATAHVAAEDLQLTRETDVRFDSTATVA
jgi:hypothetical protein